MFPSKTRAFFRGPGSTEPLQAQSVMLAPAACARFFGGLRPCALKQHSCWAGPRPLIPAPQIWARGEECPLGYRHLLCDGSVMETLKLCLGPSQKKQFCRIFEVSKNRINSGSWLNSKEQLCFQGGLRNADMHLQWPLGRVFFFLFLFNLSNFYLLDTMYAFKLLQQIHLQSIYF